MEEEILSGPGKGQRLAEEDWSRMLDRYYEIHGWDRDRGWPTKEKMKELSLAEMMAKLAAAGKDLL
jgi:aldehyde:ferredoxin oxidoreductase